MPDRTLSAILDIVDRLTAPVRNAIKLMDEVDGRVAQAAVQVQVQGAQQAQTALANTGQTVNAATNTAKTSMSGLDKVTSGVTNTVTGLGSTAKSALGSFMSATDEVAASMGTLMASLAGMAAGGAIAGISWMNAEKERLYTEQVYKSIDANKKLGLTAKETKEFIQKVAAQGWIEDTELLATVQMVQTTMGKAAKGTKALTYAESIAKVAFAYTPKEGSTYSPDYLARMVLKEGEINYRLKPEVAMMLHTDQFDKKLDTQKGRIALLDKAARDIKIEAALDERPWMAVSLYMEEMQETIGTVLAPSMRTFSKTISEVFKFISEKPDLAWLIGMAALVLTAVSAFSLLIGVLSPLYGLFMGVKVAMLGQTAAAVVATTANTAMAASEGVVAVANTGVAATAYAMAGGIWAALAPVLIIIVPLIALAAILYIVEQKTHIFSRALKALGQTQLAKDFFKWFEELGKWINQAIKWLDNLYKAEGLGGVIKQAIKTAFSMAIDAIPLFRIMAIVAGFLGGILADTGILKKVFELALPIWKKLVEIISYLWDTVKSLFGFLIDIIPGARKEEARKELEKETEKAGVTYSFEKKSFAYKGTVLDLEKHPEALAEKVGSRKAEKLIEAAQKYEKIPGFLEGLAEVIGSAIKSAIDLAFIELPTKIGDAVSKALGELPVFKELVMVLGGLQSVLMKLPGAEAYYSEVEDRANKPMISTSIKEDLQSRFPWLFGSKGAGTEPTQPVVPEKPYQPQMVPKFLVPEILAGETPKIPEIVTPKVPTLGEKKYFNEATGKYEAAPAPRIAGKYAAGTDYVPKTDIYQLERGERVIPQNRNVGTQSTVNLGGISVNVAKIASSIDIDKVANQIAKIATKAVKDAVAQRRG